jgi:hypothetical protein
MVVAVNMTILCGTSYLDEHSTLATQKQSPEYTMPLRFDAKISKKCCTKLYCHIQKEH